MDAGAVVERKGVGEFAFVDFFDDDLFVGARG